MLVSFKVYCDDMEQAIEKTVAYAEANGYNGLLLDVGEMNERAREDLAYEKALETLSDDDKAKMGYEDIVNAGMPIIDKMEDETPDEYYDAIDEELSDLIYIDATMEGAKQCYYIFSEVQAEEFDDNKVEENVKSINDLKTIDNKKFSDMVRELHSYVEADPAKISQDLKQALKSNTIDTYLSSKAGMTDDEINIFKNKYLSVDEKL